MEYWSRKIDYREYYSYNKKLYVNVNLVDEKDLKNKGTFTVSSIKLGISIAKALITKSGVYTKEIITLAKCNIMQFPIILNEDSNRNLRINAEFKKLFRDFSKTSRIGEIAQGVNYIFAEKILDCVSILDFEEYLKDNGLYSGYKGKKPDYITFYRNGKLGILESKGTIHNATQMMKSGLKQCEGRDPKVKVDCYYSAAVGFSIKGPRTTRRTTVHYIDPSEECESLGSQEYRKGILKEYAKWFCISGLYEEAKKLAQGEFIEHDKLSILAKRAKHRDNIVSDNLRLHNREGIPISVQTFYESYNEEVKIIWGISQKVFEFISGTTDYIEPVEEKFENELAGTKQIIFENYQDGTWIEVIADKME